MQELIREFMKQHIELHRLAQELHHNQHRPGSTRAELWKNRLELHRRRHEFLDKHQEFRHYHRRLKLIRPFLIDS